MKLDSLRVCWLETEACPCIGKGNRDGLVTLKNSGLEACLAFCTGSNGGPMQHSLGQDTSIGLVGYACGLDIQRKPAPAPFTDLHF